MKAYLSKLLYFIGNKKFGFIFIFILIIITSLLDTISIGLVGPFMALASNPKAIQQNLWMQWSYEKLGFRTEIQFISLLGFSILLVFWLKSLINYRTQGHIYKFVIIHQGEVRSRLLNAYLEAPYTFHLTRNTAFLIQNVLTELSTYKYKFLFPSLHLVSDSILSCFLVILLIQTDARAAAGVLGFILIPLFILYRFKNKLLYWGKEDSLSQGEMIRIVNHSLGGVKETKVLGCEPYFENQMSQQIHRYVKAASSFQVFSILPRTLLEASLVTFLVGITSLFLLWGFNSQKLISVLSVFALVAIKLMPAVTRITQGFSSVRNSLYAIDKIYLDLLQLEQPLSSSQNSKLVQYSHSSSFLQLPSLQKNIAAFTDKIELKQVTYSYSPDSEPALQDISLTIKKGQSIALIGKSGAGKTTLVDVILGLLKLESGAIEVDGVSIYENLRSWQNLIGYIPQSIFLIDDTIERNIAFGVPDSAIDPIRLNQAIEAAQLTEYVNNLPQGIQTVVGERGVRLSGGQRQRVGIARTIYHQREILVLDEATAALDNETENLVTEAIKSFSGVKTMIIIAHRLSTIDHCDCVYRIDQGRLVDSGDYQTMVLGQGNLSSAK